MVIAYLDIETYSPRKEPTFNDKIILICYKESDGQPIMYKEWESSEKNMLSEFYSFVKGRLETEQTFMIYGFNTLPFDIPLLACRLSFNKVDEISSIFDNFKKIYHIDLRQCLLPFNRFRFKDLGGDDVAKKFGFPPPKHSNKDIKMFYEKGEYGKIEEHSLSDIKLLSNLSWNMRDLEKVTNTFKP